jgi:hypothetical protein
MDEPRTDASGAADRAAAFGTLFGMVTQFWVPQALAAAATLDLPDILASGSQSTTALATATGANPDTLRRLLRALASVGVVTQESDERFAATMLSDLLRRNVRAASWSWSWCCPTAASRPSPPSWTST